MPCSAPYEHDIFLGQLNGARKKFYNLGARLNHYFLFDEFSMHVYRTIIKLHISCFKKSQVIISKLGFIFVVKFCFYLCIMVLTVCQITCLQVSRMKMTIKISSIPCKRILMTLTSVRLLSVYS